VARLAPVPLPDCRVDLVIRQAIAGEAEGFGVTAYLSAMGSDHAAAAKLWPPRWLPLRIRFRFSRAPETPASKLQ
jgi:hypothetical protein